VREGLKKVEKGKINPAKSRGIGLKRVESPLGLNPSTLPDGSTPQDDLFRVRFEHMPPAGSPTIATEVWISRRLQRPDLFAGVTDPDSRRERVRAAIEAGDMAMAVAGKRQGQSVETWADVFARVYGVPFATGARP
jgi:hypothetical protein